MEKYIPTPEDYEKAEEAMMPEQAEMTRKKEELMENEGELKEEMVLINTKNTEIIKIKNIKEIVRLITEDGYIPNDRSVYDIVESEDKLKTLGFDYKEFKRQKRLDDLRRKFEVNDQRELLYLKNGFEKWKKDVDNYWYNMEKYESDELKCGKLQKELLEVIRKGYLAVFHQEPKDFNGLSIQIAQFASKARELGYDTSELQEILDFFGDKIYFPLVGKYPGRKKFNNSKWVFDPEDKEKKDVHPLLQPFQEGIRKLEAEGVEKLPDWLLNQGLMAGYSAAYQDLCKNFKEFVKRLKEEKEKYEKFLTDKDIRDSYPKFSFIPNEYLEKLETIDSKIHRISE